MIMQFISNTVPLDYEPRHKDYSFVFMARNFLGERFIIDVFVEYYHIYSLKIGRYYYIEKQDDDFYPYKIYGEFKMKDKSNWFQEGF